MSARRICMALVLALLATSCGQDFDRSQAIAEFSATGVSNAEATCMADTLGALGLLEAADSQSIRSAESREALIAATTRCVTTSVLPRTIERRGGEFVDDDDPEGTPMEGERSSSSGNASSQDPAAVRAAAVDHLEMAGRSEQFALCVVDQLIELDAEHVLSDPAFGMGLDPLEADAFAACL